MQFQVATNKLIINKYFFILCFLEKIKGIAPSLMETSTNVVCREHVSETGDKIRKTYKFHLCDYCPSNSQTYNYSTSLSRHEETKHTNQLEKYVFKHFESVFSMPFIPFRQLHIPGVIFLGKNLTFLNLLSHF